MYGMKYSWKGHKDRNRHKNRVNRNGQARLIYVKNINRNIPTTWRWARRDEREREREREREKRVMNEWPMCSEINLLFLLQTLLQARYSGESGGKTPGLQVLTQSHGQGAWEASQLRLSIILSRPWSPSGYLDLHVTSVWPWHWFALTYRAVTFSGPSLFTRVTTHGDTSPWRDFTRQVALVMMTFALTFLTLDGLDPWFLSAPSDLVYRLCCLVSVHRRITKWCTGRLCLACYERRRDERISIYSWTHTVQISVLRCCYSFSCSCQMMVTIG